MAYSDQPPHVVDVYILIDCVSTRFRKRITIKKIKGEE